LSMVENNERGRQARLYFIECERLVLEDLRRKADSPPVVEQLDVDDGYPLLGIIIPKHTRVCLVFSDGGIREIWQPLKAIVVGTPSAVMKVAMGENSARMKEDGEEGGWRSCLPDLFIFAVRPADSVLLITNSNDPIITGFHPSFIVIGQNMYVNEYITENKLTRTFPIRWN
jgi:hypothetical protein